MPEIELKPDQERVKNLLTDTVTLLCRNSLTFRDSLRIEGLLGVSIDSSDVFFVHISENFEQNSSEKAAIVEEAEAAMFTAPASPAKSVRRPRESPCPSPSRQSQLSPASSPAQVKSEPTEDVDDLLIVEEPKQEVYTDRARQASMVAGQRRAARRREHSPLVQHHQGGWDDMGEPAAKRHMSTDSESENNGGGHSSGFGQVDENVGWPDMVTDFNQGQMFQQDPGGSSFDTTTPGCSTWPTTLATQQQTQDTVGRTGRKRPEGNLPPGPVKQGITDYLVKPLLRDNLRYLTFRLMWTSKQCNNADAIWSNITLFQREVCGQLNRLPGIEFFLSDITATVTTRGTQTIHPGLSFWVAIDPSLVSEVQVYTSMRNNNFNADLKLISNTQSELTEVERQAKNVGVVIKDYCGSYVQPRVAASVGATPQSHSGRVCVKTSADEDNLTSVLKAQQVLSQLGLHLHVEMF